MCLIVLCIEPANSVSLFLSDETLHQLRVKFKGGRGAPLCRTARNSCRSRIRSLARRMSYRRPVRDTSPGCCQPAMTRGNTPVDSNSPTRKPVTQSFAILVSGHPMRTTSTTVSSASTPPCYRTHWLASIVWDPKAPAPSTTLSCCSWDVAVPT